eukprot:CAMPEP_0201737470 /NCGR_PEP_ID=MMETSP0593-20130828/42458_1 /ASSEMBLY_ACC=CAM_ASM_000672 /TAXON_ID=267983 /ORGANISM="Skeletonema japonicum, Strain CCMP2506" /LENGTH=613 /DNA_ID=CAMNT_0048231451 /DNA_START=64 /DNA_END=1905 /DNA_ORIENTATION=+
MILLGYEMEDILRVVIGIVLGLLTIFRREMSCNREFHEEEIAAGNDDDRNTSRELDSSTQCSKLETINDEQNKRKSIRRRKSSSSLPSLTSPRTSSEVKRAKRAGNDPTEDLLESAGLFLSGGPFLAVFVAVFDHLVASTYLYALVIFESIRSLTASFRENVWDGNDLADEHVQDRGNWSRVQANREVTLDKEKQHIYNVAWNAATEYFSSISEKLGETPLSAQTTDPNNKYLSPTRSQSTGNLMRHLSDENSRELLIEMIAMANRGSMDVTLLPSDAQILICSYLPPNDLLSFSCTSKSGQKMLDDGSEHTDGPSICRDTALLIWKALFRRDFAWILSEWDIGREALLRSMACYDSETIQNHQNSHCGKVLGHVMSVVMHSAEMWDEVQPFNSPFTGIIDTPASMKEFYFLFSEVWLNYTIAGCNTTDKCLIGLHGHVVDISNFVEDHPGSTETLLLQAGRDATVFFESMGHSRSARKLGLGMTVVVNSQCIHWQYTNAIYKERSTQSSQTCGLLRPSSKLLGANKNIPGFLIPIKRSRPRSQGGLHTIRRRLKEEEEIELRKAQRWVNMHLGSESLYGGVQVYYDPFCSCWRWWYTNLDFNPVFSESVDQI